MTKSALSTKLKMAKRSWRSSSGTQLAKSASRTWPINFINKQMPLLFVSISQINYRSKVQPIGFHQFTSISQKISPRFYAVIRLTWLKFLMTTCRTMLHKKKKLNMAWSTSRLQHTVVKMLKKWFTILLSRYTKRK